MKTPTMKNLLPYVGLPVLCLAFFLWGRQGLPSVEVLNYELLIIFGYVLALHDLKYQIVPNITLLVMLAVWCMTRIPVFFSDFTYGLQLLMASALGGLVGGGVFLVVYAISKKGLGAGDVKFMAVAGLYLGYNLVLSSMLLGSILSAITGLLLLCFKKINKKDAIPLVPFLYVGILLTIFLQ